MREPEDYLAELFDQHPDELVGVVREMAEDRSNPPMTVNETVDALARAGVPAFAATVRRRLSQKPSSPGLVGAFSVLWEGEALSR